MNDVFDTTLEFGMVWLENHSWKRQTRHPRYTESGVYRTPKGSLLPKVEKTKHRRRRPLFLPLCLNSLKYVPLEQH
jgi:hypothetical protein